MSDQERLAGYVEVWWRAVGDFVSLLESLSPEEWTLPTDLPGWDVHDIAAHTAHLEGVLAGAPEETLEFEPGPHVRGLLGWYTEQGVLARRDRSPEELLAEIRSSTAARYTALSERPPTDGAARPERIFGGVPWDWERLLRNRPLDVWMHDQDVRRAVGRPGGMDSPAARHTADYLTESLPVVVAKRAKAAPGTVVALRVTGSPPVAAMVGDDGRGAMVAEADLAAAPTVRISTDREAFIRLAGGRGAPDSREIAIEGDQELGQRILAGIAVTP